MSPVHSSMVRIRQPEPLQDFLGARGHALVLGEALLGRGDGDQLDLGELVLADHAARVLAGGARFRAEARRPRGEAHRQLRFVEDFSRTKLVSDTSAVGMSQ